MDALRTKEMLVVLDNCEHLMDAAARLMNVLLDSCPRLQLQATSREALDVAGELRWSVPSHRVPATRRSLTMAELEGYESALLFVERAVTRRSSFELGSESTRAVAEIGERLDRMPLATELAAARIGTLSVEQIPGRLNLLTGGSRTVMPGQRTLRATLDWSRELLEVHGHFIQNSSAIHRLPLLFVRWNYTIL